ncbi:MAG: hypothetical protein MUC50_11630 [Myxococcota bacterium]|jgi:DNA-directed RNA polymerase specialized sigma24 family protein|nr:hypothetical protein [Myxococcota bacterium]
MEQVAGSPAADRVGGEPVQVLTVELVRRAVEGREPGAVTLLVGLLAPILQATVARVLLRRGAIATGRSVRAAVEDITQEVFERLLAQGGRRLLMWDPSLGSAQAFFGLVAQRYAHNVLDSRRRSPFTEEPAEPAELEKGTGTEPDLERALCSRDALRRLGKRLEEGLNERDLKLFQLLYIEQLDDEEARTRLGIGRDALYQARRRLLLRARELARDIAAEM